MNARLIAAVAAGGALGAAARYGLAEAWPAHGFAWATFVTNVTGCLAIGLLLGVERGPLTRAFLGTGVLGGFTTFSTYAVQSTQLWQSGRPLPASFAALGTVVCCLLGAWCGTALVRRRRS